MNTMFSPFGEMAGDAKFSPAANASIGIRGGIAGAVTGSAAKAALDATPNITTPIDAEHNRRQFISTSPEFLCRSMLLDDLRDRTGCRHSIFDRGRLARGEPHGLVRGVSQPRGADAGMLAVGA